MKKSKMISVIVPVYNEAPFLKQSVKSILLQPLKSIEVILVDDGSTDGSSDICDELAKRDKRVICIHQKNAGVSVARNVGIKNASSDWVMFVDPDDYLADDCLNDDFERMLKSDYDTVVFDYSMVEQHTEKRIFTLPISKSAIVSNCKEDLLSLCAYQIGFGKRNCPIGLGAPWAKLYRKNFIKENQLHFIPGMKRSQDVLFNMCAITLAHSIYYERKNIYRYRIYDASSSNRYTPDAQEAADYFLDEFEKIISHLPYTTLKRNYALLVIRKIQTVAKLQYLSYANPMSYDKRVGEFISWLRTPRLKSVLTLSNGVKYGFSVFVWIFLLKCRWFRLIQMLIQ